MKILDEIRAVVRHRYARQFSLLFTANVAVAVVSFFSNLLINNHLSELEYGTYRYATNFLQLGMNAVTLGLPYSAARLLALEQDRERQRRIMGATYALMGLACVAGLLLTWAIYFGAPLFGLKGLDGILVVAPLFLYITVLEYVISNLCTGANNIRLLSSQLAMPVSLVLIFTAVQVYILKSYGLWQALAAFAISHTVIIAVGIRRLRPSMKALRAHIAAVVHENRTTGLPVYFGQLLGVVSVQLISLMIPAFVGMKNYAQYALAYSISAPLALVASTLGTVIFRSSADAGRLPRKVVLYSFGGCAALAAVYVLLIRILIFWLFGERYLPAAPMAQVMGVGALMVGLGDILNRYLGANGRGRMLLTGAAVTGIVAVASAAALLPSFGAMGASISRGVANAAYLASMIALYKLRNAKIRIMGGR
jgi:O-antigen/teichoic acid export membrane protein